MHQALRTVSVLLAKVLMIRFPFDITRAEPTPSKYKRLIHVHFGVGDLVKTKDGLLMIGVDARTLVYMEVQRGYGVMRMLDKYCHSQGWAVRLFRWVDSFPYGGHKGYLVAQAVVNRKVPYDRWRCNQHHYMDYFLLGRIRGRWMSYSYGPMSEKCPLTRDMVEVFRNSIGGQDFYLQDKTRKRIYPEKLELIHPPTESPQPCESDSSPKRHFCAPAKNEYKSLILIQFGVGDLVKSKGGLLMIGVDERTLVYLEVRSWYAIVRKVDKYEHSPGWDSRLFRRVDKYPYGGHKGYLVAQALVDRKVPYGSWRCNQHHYMNYFLLGGVRGCCLSYPYGPMSPWCPLTRDMVEVLRSDIGGPDFYLLDKNRRKIYPERLELVPKEEPLQQYHSSSPSTEHPKPSTELQHQRRVG